MSEAARIPVMLIMGPTGAGKTDLAIYLSERYPIEIVSVDSAMVYRGMDIGTGKPTPEVLARHPHHLVDILDPSETYSAGQFVRDVRQVIDEIHGRRHLPVLVGGTMLYFRALRRGLAALPGADPKIRAEIDREANVVGWPAMHAELAAIDARSAARIRPNDAQRIQRALEVFRISGKPLSEFHAEVQGPDADLAFSTYAWVPSDRERLYVSIRMRFQEMLRSGLLEEVGRLHQRPDLHADLPSIRAVGYRQLWEYLDGRVSLEVATENAIVATRHLARRQLIWLRGDDEVTCIDSLEPDARAHIEDEIMRLCSSLGAK
jgi:tRNA dimethylallyltransferase